MIKDILESLIKIFGFKKLKNLTVVIEIVVIFLISFFIGHAINPDDPFLTFEQSFNYFYIPILVLSLFYGMGSGILLLMLYVIFSFFYLKEFPENFFLEGLLISLITGEFHYYWTKKIEAALMNINFLEERLREIGVAAYTIKISHDMLEKSYISKPYSIRTVLSKVIKEENNKDFFKFISNQFFLESFIFIEYSPHKEEMENIHFYNTKEEKIDLDHPLIEKMFFLKEIVYIKDIINFSQEYIAAIPILDLHENIRAFILIKNMPFIHFNSENLLSVQLISQYFLWNLEKEKNIKEVSKKIPLPCSDDIKYEIFNLYKLKKIFDISSTIVLLKVKKNYFSVIDNFLRQSLRGLDLYAILDNIFIIILPLVPKESGIGFVNRMFEKFDFIDKQYKYFIFEINEIENIDEVLKDLIKMDKKKND